MIQYDDDTMLLMYVLFILSKWNVMYICKMNFMLLPDSIFFVQKLLVRNSVFEI